MTQDPEQDPDRGGLSRAIRAEEAVNFAGGDVKVQTIERPDGAVVFCKFRDADSGSRGIGVCVMSVISSFLWSNGCRSPNRSDSADRADSLE